MSDDVHGSDSNNTELNVMLLLGKITAAQYDPVRHAMVLNGLKKPVAVRIGIEHRFEGLPNIEAADQKFGIGHNDEDIPDDIADVMDEFQEGVYEGVFQQLRDRGIEVYPHQVRAVIFEACEENPDWWLWIGNFLPKEVPTYRINIRQDGHWRIRGKGIGDPIDHTHRPRKTK